MSKLHNPLHPGETLREDVLPALGLSVTEAAEQLGVARPSLSRVLNGHAAISPEMALRIEKWLGVENGGRADLWLADRLLMIYGKRELNSTRKLNQLNYYRFNLRI